MSARQQQAHDRHTTTVAAARHQHDTNTMSVQQQAYDNNRHTTTGARQQHDRICSVFLKLCPIGGMDEQLCPHRGHGRTALLPSGAGKGREPLQVGTGGKQEQGQPWAKSQYYGDGWQEQGQPWAKSQYYGDGWQEQGQPWAESQFCGNGRQAGIGQQGHFCFCRKGTDNKAALGQSAVAERCGRQTGQHLRAECRSKKGRKANRAAFRAECRSRKGAAGLIKKKAF